MAPKSTSPPEPPPGLVREMAELFHAGQLELLEQKAVETVRQWPDHPFGWKALANLRVVQGRMKDALDPLVKSVQLAPDDAQALNNLGSVYFELGRFQEAEKRFRQALSIDHDYVQALNNLAIILLERGPLEEAAAVCQRALELKPDFAEAHNNLGNIHKELGQLKEAEADYRNALVINPDFAEAHYNLGIILLELGHTGGAQTSFRQALALNPDYAQAHCGLGETFFKRGRFGDALARYQKCITLDPMWVKAHESLNRSRSQLIPLWHVPMMNDRFRNEAYYAALERAVGPDTKVLEIGTGSGLLAMMAARLGARQVTTCEAVPEIAGMARSIIGDNGLESKIRVVPKLSTTMKVGEDMDMRADLLVSEILSSEFLGEGVLTSIEDAKRRLLKPGGQIIPARGSIQFALFGGAEIEKNVRVEEVYGFDLSRFNDIVARKQYVNSGGHNIELLSDNFCAFAFDFGTTDRFPSHEQKNIEVPVRRKGRCCGIIQWIRLEMDDRIVFENHPSVNNPAAGWQLCAYIFPSLIEVSPGQIVSITAARNRNTPWFFLQG